MSVTALIGSLRALGGADRGKKRQVSSNAPKATSHSSSLIEVDYHTYELVFTVNARELARDPKSEREQSSGHQKCVNGEIRMLCVFNFCFDPADIFFEARRQGNELCETRVACTMYVINFMFVESPEHWSCLTLTVNGRARCGNSSSIEAWLRRIIFAQKRNRMCIT